MSKHPARLENSPRLQRVHDLLADGREYSTMEIVLLANVCAVNSIADELRHPVNDVDIRCRQEGKVFFYKRWDVETEEAA